MSTNNNHDKKKFLEFAHKKLKTVDYDKLAMQGKKPTGNTTNNINNNKKD